MPSVHTISDKTTTVSKEIKMANEGRYVRAPEYATDSEEADSDEQILLSPDLEDSGISDLEESRLSESERSLSDVDAPVVDDDDDTSKEKRDRSQIQQDGMGFWQALSRNQSFAVHPKKMLNCMHEWTNSRRY